MALFVEKFGGLAEEKRREGVENIRKQLEELGKEQEESLEIQVQGR